jgi:hypothetical protein
VSVADRTQSSFGSPRIQAGRDSSANMIFHTARPPGST